jgi:hypothetical protein
MARLKIAPQRGHAVASAEIMARQAGHDVILVMALPRAAICAVDFSCGQSPFAGLTPSLCNPRFIRRLGFGLLLGDDFKARKLGDPKGVDIATSAASRPRCMTIRPMRGLLWRARL